MVTPRSTDDLALVGLLLAGDHAEQRGLAGAVGADEADLLALLERRRGLDEEDLLAVCLLMLSRRIMRSFCAKEVSRSLSPCGQ